MLHFGASSLEGLRDFVHDGALFFSNTTLLKKKILEDFDREEEGSLCLVLTDFVRTLMNETSG